MKIDKLTIHNFLAIESLEMDLQAPVNIIAGPNEAGKSSLRDAVQWCLTGQARGLKTHEAQAQLIHDGAKAAEVTLTLADKQVLARKKTPKTPATVTGPVPDDQVMFSILADPLAFLSLADKERREVLFKHIPGLNPTRKDIGMRLVDSLVEVLPEKTPTDATIDTIDELAKKAEQDGFAAAETEAITRRRVAKSLRSMATVDEPAPRATIGDKEFILPDIQAPDVEKGLSVLRTERDTLLKKRGKMEAQADKLPELEAALARLEAECPDLQEEGKVEEWEKFLEINRPILDDLKKQAEALKPGKAPRFYPDLCPVFSGSDVPCPKAKEVGVSGDIAPDPVKVKKVTADLQEQEVEVVRLVEGLKLAQAKQGAFDSYTQTRQALVDKIAKLKAQEDQATVTAGIDEQITALDFRLQVGLDLLDAVRKFWREKEAADAAAVKLAEADKEVVLYDALAKALAPTGIPSQLITEALGPVNERLAFGSGYLFPDCDEHQPLHLTQDLEVYRGITPFSLLSKSARYRAGICFQYVLATLAGARLFLVDEADILDPLNRSQLIDFLLAVHKDFDTILVFATSDHADPSPIPELAVWWIQDGVISPVRAREAA